MENKRGFTTFQLIPVIFIAIVLLITLGIFSYALGLVDDQISQLDADMGNNKTFNGTYAELMQPGLQTLEVNVPRNISIATIIGMVLVTLLIGTMSDKKSNLWILLDIMIIILAEIVAVAVSKFFQDSILNLTPELYTIFSTTLSASSKWILNLPIIIPTVGCLIMLATYILRRREDKDVFEEFG